MSDWGGPYIVAMLTTSWDADPPIRSVETDAGSLQSIVGIGNVAVIPRLGWTVQFRFTVVLAPGNRTGSDHLSLSLIEPDGTIQMLPKQPFDYPEMPTDVVRFTIPIGIEVGITGVYWIRAQVGNRMLSRVPFQVDLLPEIPAAFQQIDW